MPGTLSIIPGPPHPRAFRRFGIVRRYCYLLFVLHLRLEPAACPVKVDNERAAKSMHAALLPLTLL